MTLEGKSPPLLRMFIPGEGGTGKSKVIQCLTEYFRFRHVEPWLVKAAYTGIAASIINGMTLHMMSHITVRKPADLPSSDAIKKLQEFWRDKNYVVIDEVSMLSREFMALLSRNIRIGKGEHAKHTAGSPSFGGINVIIVGDFHQFPPVAAASGPLYIPAQPSSGNEQRDLASIGRMIYEEFDTVTMLKKQIRIEDEEWATVLRALRAGDVLDDHVEVLKSITLGDRRCPKTDFSTKPWSDAVLITSRHCVRIKWNEASIRKWCHLSGNRLFVCEAMHTVKGAPLTEELKLALQRRSASSKQTAKNDLPATLEIAIGMKVMVTENVETELDIANGARGVIREIILDPREPPVDGDANVVQLQYLPLYILVKMDRTRIAGLSGLEDGVVPLMPRTQKIQVSLQGGNKPVTKTITRSQFPLTAAYAFTDYRSQGQTLQNVVVDIAKPPSGTYGLFNVYVALSRSRGRQTIRILRKFDDSVLRGELNANLLREDDRIARLDEKTEKAWKESNGSGR